MMQFDNLKIISLITQDLNKQGGLPLLGQTLNRILQIPGRTHLGQMEGLYCVVYW